MLISPEHASLLRSNPICILDVGARGGFQEHWRHIGEHCMFVGFEPEAEEARRLTAQAAGNELYLAHALYREEQTATLYHCADPRCSSLYPPNLEVLEDLYTDPARYRVVRTEPIRVTTLDTLIASNATPSPDFIKLDCQGAELDILKGSKRALASSLIGIEAEVEFVPLYEGQPLALDVTEWLRTQGFELMEFRTLVRRADIRFGLRGDQGYEHAIDFIGAWAGRVVPPRGASAGMSQLVYGDALYMRRPRSYVEWVRTQPSKPLGSVLKAVVLSTELRLYEYALRMIETASLQALITGAEREELTRFVEQRSRDPQRVIEEARRVLRKLVRRLRKPGRR